MLNITSTTYNTGKSSKWFGNCAICKHYVTESYCVVTREKGVEINAIYGHKECLDKQKEELKQVLGL